jgi:MFS superfamily sulfate permease-like transporter
MTLVRRSGAGPTSRTLPFLRGVLPLERGRVGRDVVAGITLAALGIPEVMGYTKISGTPVVTGLYTLLAPVVAFAVLGGSRHLVVAADSATAAMLASMLASVAALGSPEYVRLTSLVALTAAGMLVLARVFKLGFLADFLSRSALVGFLTGVGVQVACGELAGLLGLPKEGGGAVAQVGSVLRRLGSTHLATLGISVAVLAVIVGGTRLSRRIPAALVAVAGAVAASAAFGLAARGVATLGSVPGGLPSLALPFMPRAGELYRVIGCAASCFIVIVAQSAATARAYALRHDEEPAEESDLVGLAAANAAAAITGTFVVNGSPTKTEMVDDAGGRSQLAHLTTALAVLLVLLFLTGPLGLLPTAVLSAIVFLIGVKLVDLRGMAELWRLQRGEFWIATIAAATVVARDAIDGIAVAAALSLVEHVRHTYRPRTRVLVPGAGGGWDAIAPAPDRLAAPGVLAYRFEANLFYANASLFMKEVMTLLANASQPVKAVVLDTTGVDDIDFSAAKMLLQLRRELQARGVALAVVVSYHVVLNVLTRFGVIEDASDGSVHHSLDTAVAALQVQAAVAATIAPPPRPGSVG